MLSLNSPESFKSYSPLAMLTALILFLLLVVLTRNYFQGNLRHLPGPFLHSISILPRMWSVYKGRSQWDDLSLHKKYGSFVRIGPKLVSVADPSMLDQIYGISSKFYKSGFYEPVRFHDEEGLIPDPFVLADKAMHGRMKRNAANAYALQALVQLEPMVDSVVERLLNHLEESYAVPGNVCDIGQYMHFFAMDAIFTVTYGRDMDFIKNGDAKGFCKHIQDGLVYMTIVGQIPWAHPFLLGSKFNTKLLEWFGGGETIMDEMMNIAVTQRSAAEKHMDSVDDTTAPCTFLMRLLRNQIKNPAAITDREINCHTFGNIIAGGDTTSTAIRAIISNLIQHPEAMNRLLMELKEAGLSSHGRPASYATTSKLPYLSAVVHESLRLHPSVGMMLARGVPTGGASFAVDDGRKVWIGDNVEIGINPWIIHRDPAIFPDPEAFVPQRWLDATPEQLARMTRAWIPFGAGRHTCSGQHISMMEINKLVPSLVMRFNMAWERGSLDISVVNYFFTIQRGMRVKITRRKE